MARARAEARRAARRQLGDGLQRAGAGGAPELARETENRVPAGRTQSTSAVDAGVRIWWRDGVAWTRDLGSGELGRTRPGGDGFARPTICEAEARGWGRGLAAPYREPARPPAPPRIGTPRGARCAGGAGRRTFSTSAAGAGPLACLGFVAKVMAVEVGRPTPGEAGRRRSCVAARSPLPRRREPALEAPGTPAKGVAPKSPGRGPAAGRGLRGAHRRRSSRGRGWDGEASSVSERRGGWPGRWGSPLWRRRRGGCRSGGSVGGR